MRISDWSSYVCSSDLIFRAIIGGVERIDVGTNLLAEHLRQAGLVGNGIEAREIGLHRLHPRRINRLRVDIGLVEIGDASFVAALFDRRLDDRVNQVAVALFGFEEGGIKGSGDRKSTRLNYS